MPQFDFHFLSPLVFWSIVSFGLLLFLLYRYALPVIFRTLEEREKKIRESIEEAERVRKEAHQLLAQYQEKLKGAGQEVQAILEEARHRALQLLEENQQRMEREGLQMIEEARGDIQRERQQALREIQQVVAELTVAATEKILERNLTQADHRRFVEEVIREIAQERNQ
jgi:F-type H+-transporting ATPase subunit b